MQSLVISLSETFEFLQPLCSVALRKQEAFESVPLVKSFDDIPTACATEETKWEEEILQRCDTSLTTTLSDDEMMVCISPAVQQQQQEQHSDHITPVPTSVSFFTPHKKEQLNRLQLQWHVKRAAGGIRGIDEWIGTLDEEADARQDTREHDTLGNITCLRISPNLDLSTNEKERLHHLQVLHPQLPALTQHMSKEQKYFYRDGSSTKKYPKLYSLPLLMITHMYIAKEHRGNGLGLLLVDEACRCLGNPAQWVMLTTTQDTLSDYFGILGFQRSEQSNVLLRWNDAYCMATHRYEDVCPHLPHVTIR
jgi:hypothetical protein